MSQVLWRTSQRTTEGAVERPAQRRAERTAQREEARIETPMGGHDEEFSAYVAARSTAWLRVAFLLTRNRADAEDLLQTSLTKVYIAWHRISDKGALDSYVRRVLVNTQTTLWRRRTVDEYATADLPEVSYHEETADQRTASESLWAALQTLPNRQRAMVILRYYEDLSETETASVMGVSVGTVKSTVSRALVKLRDQVDHERTF